MSGESVASKIILYGHSACPGVGPVKNMLKHAEVEFEYVNIFQDVEAAARVRTINNGHESVPTLVFPDGSTLTEPSMWELKSKLESLGYEASLLAWAMGSMWRIVLFGIVIYSVLRFLEVI